MVDNQGSQAPSERRRRKERGACAKVEGAGGVAPLASAKGLWSAVSSPSGVRGEAPAAFGFISISTHNVNAGEVDLICCLNFSVLFYALVSTATHL